MARNRPSTSRYRIRRQHREGQGKRIRYTADPFTSGERAMENSHGRRRSLARDLRFAIVASRFNEFIVDRLDPGGDRNASAGTAQPKSRSSSCGSRCVRDAAVSKKLRGAPPHTMRSRAGCRDPGRNAAFPVCCRGVREWMSRVALETGVPIGVRRAHDRYHRAGRGARGAKRQQGRRKQR